MPGFRCPFCNQFMVEYYDTCRSYHVNFEGFFDPINSATSRPHAVLTMHKCPNNECKQITFVVESALGFLAEDMVTTVHPKAIYRHFPTYVPQAIRNDYEEASVILNSSPKAAATLARRCLQGMIRDFWKVTDKRNLNQEIQAIKDKVSPSQWNAIDATRKIGNIGAHMEQDVNLIVDVDVDEAKRLLQLIELLIDKWYIARHDEETLLNQIIATGDEVTAVRDSQQEH